MIMNKTFTKTISRLILDTSQDKQHLKGKQNNFYNSVLNMGLNCCKILFIGLILQSLLLTNAVAQQATAKSIVVKGKVLDDEDGQPLIGVTITNSTKKVLGVTNDKGDYSVSLTAPGDILFNMVGYNTIKRSVSANQNGLNIRLKPSTGQLNDVVVTALGIKREEKALGYAVTKIDSTQFTDAPSNNWTDALSGKVAGLNMIGSGGGPASSNKIILRGENNLTGDNEALIVVDGVIVSSSSGKRTGSGMSAYGTGSDNMPVDYGSGINDINPDDIESVTVLKGPGASALYGQRGANGAIIITTKSANTKRKTMGIKFTSNGSMQEVNRWPALQYEYGQGLDGAAYYSYGASADGASTSGTSSAYGPRVDPSLKFFQYDGTLQGQGKERTPWVAYPNQIREFFSPGYGLNNALTIDTKLFGKTNARISVSNNNTSWIVPNTDYERTTASFNTTTDITKKLKLTTKLNYNNRAGILPGQGYGNQSIMYWYIFWMPTSDLNWIKNYWVNGKEYQSIKYPYSSFPENPYAIVNEFTNSTNRNGITANAQASYQFTKEFSFQVAASIDRSKDFRQEKRPYDAGSRLPQGSYRTAEVKGQETNLSFLARYSKKINKDISFDLSAGGSQMSNKYRKGELRADGLKVPNIYEMTNNLYPIISIPDTANYKINSFYGLLSTSFKNYLYVDVTARQDWNSVLATPNRLDNVGFFYPSVSTSFVLSEFFKMNKKINFAKIRASVSQVGSGSNVPYRTAYTYGLASSGLYPDSALLNPTTLPNADLKPLKTTTFEVGTEWRLFKNRLNIDLAYYMGATKNQILSRIVDKASGYSTAVVNAGRVDNVGFEAAINGSVIKTKSFTWSLSTTFSTNKNKIKELTDSTLIIRTGPVAGGQIVAKVGGSMGDMYGRGYQRDPNGNVIYDAGTGIAKITDEVVYLGNTIPKYKGSIGSNFVYKQFSLNVLFDAQFGGVAHSLMHYKMVEQGKLEVTLPGRYNGIIGVGVVKNADGTYRTNDVIATNIDEYYRSHMGADNAEGSTFSTDFIKFREASLNYKFKAQFLKKIGLNNASIGVYGRDLFIWSPWPMFDPQFGTLSGSDIVSGFETGQMPSTRTFGFNLSIGI
jgi:TonB-linked SusC/RagA family outer membrane protein